MANRGLPEVLIVDDRKENLLSLEAVLGGCPCSVLAAESGNQALSLMLDHDFACVLMDVQMPGMDGFETATLMQQSSRTSRIPIIFITAYDLDEGYVWKGYKRGAFDYIFKPVDPFILRSKVNVFLDLHEQRRLLEESLAEKELLLKEAHHRIKNNLAVISSIIALQAPLIADEGDRRAFRQLERRIDSITLVHELLYKGGDVSSIGMREYLKALLAGIVATMGSPIADLSTRTDVTDLRATNELAVPIGLIVTECATNSLKHAFPDGRRGLLFVELGIEGAEGVLVIGDDGVGMSPADLGGSEASLGMRLTSALVAQIGGRLRMRDAQGTVFEIRFPIDGKLFSGNREPQGSSQ